MAVNVRLPRLSRRVGLPRNFLAVLVGAGIEKHVVATEAPVARKRVGIGNLKGKADVGLGVYVGQRGGNVARLIR